MEFLKEFIKLFFLLFFLFLFFFFCFCCCSFFFFCFVFFFFFFFFFLLFWTTQKMLHQSFSLFLLLFLLNFVVCYDNGVGERPPMGWNTWCTDDACGATDFCSEKEVKSIARAMVSENMTGLGYEYVNMDDCWSAHTRDQNGNLQADHLRFPSGMPSLVQYIHSLGLKVGLYTCVGTKTCKYNRPGSYGYYDQDANTLASWGVDFVKADYCSKPAGVDGKTLYQNFSRALNATGRPILFSLCQWGEEDVYSWGAEYGQMFRIQMDHLPDWHWPPTAAGAGFGQGVKDIVDYMATLTPSKTAKQFGYMDPDFLETLFPQTMPYDVSKVEMSFWCLWMSPLLVATDIRNMSDTKRSIIMNEELIQINQDPLFISGDIISSPTSTTSTWSKPLKNGSFAVIFFNSGPRNEHKSFKIDWTQLGWSQNAVVSVRDVWEHEDLGDFTGSFETSVVGHDVFMFIATQVN